MKNPGMNELEQALRDGLRTLPPTELSRQAVLYSLTDPQHNRRLNLACCYFAQFREWPLPMEDLSVELLKLRVQHAIDGITGQSGLFPIPDNVSPLVFALTDYWQKHGPRWLAGK